MRHTLVFHTTNLGRKLQKLFTFRSPLAALSYSESYALVIIDSLKDISQSQIAARLNLDPASVVSLIDELEKQKLVKREELSSDRRKYKILLTPKGGRVVGRIKRQTVKMDAFLKEKLSQREAENFHLTLDKLNLYLNQWKGGDK